MTFLRLLQDWNAAAENVSTPIGMKRDWIPVFLNASGLISNVLFGSVLNMIFLRFMQSSNAFLPMVVIVDEMTTDFRAWFPLN